MSSSSVSKMEFDGICTHLRSDLRIRQNSCDLGSLAPKDGYLSISPNKWSMTDLSKDTQAYWAFGGCCVLCSYSCRIVHVEDADGICYVLFNRAWHTWHDSA